MVPDCIREQANHLKVNASLRYLTQSHGYDTSPSHMGMIPHPVTLGHPISALN